MLRSFRLVSGPTPDDTSCSSLHSLSNTNALYCRAVMGKLNAYLGSFSTQGNSGQLTHLLIFIWFLCYGDKFLEIPYTFWCNFVN